MSHDTNSLLQIYSRVLHGNGDGSNTAVTVGIPRESRSFAGESCGNTVGMKWPVAGLLQAWNGFPR